MNFQEWQGAVSIIKDIVTVIVTIIGGSVALYGLIAWKRQLKGKTEYELARRFLRCVYKMRDAISVVRKTYVTVAEVEQVLTEAGIPPEMRNEFNDKTKALVYLSRLKKLDEAKSELELELLEAEISWGEEVINRTQPLNKCIYSLSDAVREYLHDLNKNLRPKMDDDIHDTVEPVRQYTHILYEARDRDEFAEQISTTVRRIEAFLKPHLRF